MNTEQRLIKALEEALERQETELHDLHCQIAEERWERRAEREKMYQKMSELRLIIESQE